MTASSRSRSTTWSRRSTASSGSKGDRGLSDEELARVRDIEVALDQCWDLLRQRRARRVAGQDPEDVAVRPAGVVEGYQQ